jgi:ribokinase
MADVVVLGQVGRDLVLRVAALPDAGSSATVGDRRELLGGKGANQAVALAQLGVPVALVGVVGDDRPGADALAQAAADGVDVSGVVRRPGAATALLVDVVEDGGRRRLLEHVPVDVLLTPEDVAAAADRLGAARVVSLQLQQPGPALRAALDRAPEGALVVATEGQAAWSDGDVLVPRLGGDPVDPTGAGDAYIATLLAVLLNGAAPEDAAWAASAVASLTVVRAGGRPHLCPDALRDVVRRSRSG